MSRPVRIHNTSLAAGQHLLPVRGRGAAGRRPPAGSQWGGRGEPAGVVARPHPQGQGEDRQDDLRHHLRLHPLLEPLHRLRPTPGKEKIC